MPCSEPAGYCAPGAHCHCGRGGRSQPASGWKVARPASAVSISASSCCWAGHARVRRCGPPARRASGHAPALRRRRRIRSQRVRPCGSTTGLRSGSRRQSRRTVQPSSFCMAGEVVHAARLAQAQGLEGGIAAQDEATVVGEQQGSAQRSNQAASSAWASVACARAWRSEPMSGRKCRCHSGRSRSRSGAHGGTAGPGPVRVVRHGPPPARGCRRAASLPARCR